MSGCVVNRMEIEMDLDFRYRKIPVRDVSLECKDESRTKQSDAISCDINEIMRGYQAGQPVSHFNALEGRFGDVSEVGDYLEALNTVRAAEAAFAELPANVRSKFDNDPAKLVEAAFDPAQAELFKELGLTRPGDETPPGSAPVTPATTSGAKADASPPKS